MIDDKYEDILGKDEEKEESDSNSEDIKEEEQSVNPPSFNIEEEVEKHVKNAFSLLRERKLQEAKEELDEAYNLDENNPYIYLGKVLLKYNFEGLEELEKTANIQVVTDNFFKAALELAEGRLKERLKKVVEEVNYNYSESNLMKASFEELLNHLKIQVEKKLDYTYTISLILGQLYRNFRFFDRSYVDANFLSDTFLTQIKTYDRNFNYYIEILYHYDSIKEVKDIIQRIIAEHNDILGYVLFLFYREVPSIQSKEELYEIRDFLEVTYINHEADELIYSIDQKCHSRGGKFNKKAAIIVLSTIAGIAVLAGTGTGVGVYVYNQSATIDGIHYQRNSTGFTLTSISANISEVTFPDSVRDTPITAISATAFAGKNITKVVDFPKEITEIPANAFEGCALLETFTFENNSSLTSIGKEAFKDCVALTTFEVTEKVTTIGSNAFLNTPELIYITNNSDKEFDGEDAGLTARTCTFTYEKDGISQSGTETYYSWDKTINIPTGSKTNYDFEGYYNGSTEYRTSNIDTKLGLCDVAVSGKSMNIIARYVTGATVTIDGVTYSKNEDGASYSVSGFDYETFKTTGTGSNASTTLVFKDKINDYPVTGINDSVFKGETNLTSVSFPYYIEKIGTSAFEGATKLKTIKFNSKPTTDTTSTGYSLTSIGASAFKGCVALETVTLEGKSTLTIGNNTFGECTGLKKLTNNSNATFDNTACAAMGLAAKTLSITNRTSSTSATTSSSNTTYYLIQKTLAVTDYSGTSEKAAISYGQYSSYSEAETRGGNVIIDLTSSPSYVTIAYEKTLTTSEKNDLKLNLTGITRSNGNKSATFTAAVEKFPSGMSDDNFEISFTASSSPTTSATASMNGTTCTVSLSSSISSGYDISDSTSGDNFVTITITATIKRKESKVVEISNLTSTKNIYLQTASTNQSSGNQTSGNAG